jgi:protein-L-isoaspartate(D-aspartate) O-methyltransferase
MFGNLTKYFLVLLLCKGSVCLSTGDETVGGDPACRLAMVSSLSLQGVFDHRILDAISKVDRRAFASTISPGRLSEILKLLSVPDSEYRFAEDPRLLDAISKVNLPATASPVSPSEIYDSKALPLPTVDGHDIASVPNPWVAATMVQHLNLPTRGETRVLDVGRGRGYLAAILSGLATHVNVVEMVPQWLGVTSFTLAHQGYRSIKCIYGDGISGWPEAGPFDGIVVSVSVVAGKIPSTFLNQLKVGGRLVIPVYHAKEKIDFLHIIKKTDDSMGFTEQIAEAVTFFPLNLPK